KRPSRFRTIAVLRSLHIALYNGNRSFKIVRNIYQELRSRLIHLPDLFCFLGYHLLKSLIVLTNLFIKTAVLDRHPGLMRKHGEKNHVLCPEKLTRDLFAKKQNRAYTLFGEQGNKGSNAEIVSGR